MRVTFLFVAATPVLAANSWRYGSRLVGNGSGIEEVYALCGEPTDQTTATEFVTAKVCCDVAVTRAVVDRYSLGRQAVSAAPA
jgi:hypothetical protein